MRRAGAPCSKPIQRSRLAPRSPGTTRTPLPTRWAALGNGRGPAQGVLHTRDCGEAPKDAPLLDLDRALDGAENPATQLCTLCDCAQEPTPLLRGFDHIGDSDDSRPRVRRGSGTDAQHGERAPIRRTGPGVSGVSAAGSTADCSSNGPGGRRRAYSRANLFASVTEPAIERRWKA
ncbi:DUF6233 domain-containing protein [Streptomyces sp. NPDC003998]